MNLALEYFSRTRFLHIHFQTRSKIYLLDMCPKRFSRSDKLKQHRDVHLGIKSHVCATCNKKYSQAYSLTLHKRSHVSFVVTDLNQNNMGILKNKE